MAQYKLRWPSQEPVTAPEPGVSIDAYLERREGVTPNFTYTLVKDGHKTIVLLANEIADIWAANATNPLRKTAIEALIRVKLNTTVLIAADAEFEHMNTLYPSPDTGFVVTG
jgi:hypothetical protein